MNHCFFPANSRILNCDDELNIGRSLTIKIYPSSTSNRPSHLDRSISPGSGITCILFGGAFLTLNDAALKWLSGEYPVGEIMALRGMFAWLPILLLVWKEGGWYSLGVGHLNAQIARALFFAGSSFLWVYGLKIIPLADAVAITFTGPIMITALAPLFLGETVGWRRWIAVVIGFCGVLLMVKPMGEGAQLAAFIPLCAIIGGVARDIITRRISAQESTVGTLAFTTTVASFIGLITLPFGWITPNLHDCMILAISGILMGLAHYLYIESLRLAKAVIVVPFKYFNMIWAVMLGFLIWGDLPDMWVLSGTVLVILSGLYIMHRESLLRR